MKPESFPRGSSVLWRERPPLWSSSCCARSRVTAGKRWCGLGSAAAWEPGSSWPAVSRGPPCSRMSRRALVCSPWRRRGQWTSSSIATGCRPCRPTSTGTRRQSRKIASATRPSTPCRGDRWPRRRRGSTSRRPCSISCAQRAWKSIPSPSPSRPARPLPALSGEGHRLASEAAVVPAEPAKAVERARSEGRRVLAVGTTTTRTLEWSADANGRLRVGPGEADLFIRPGHRFRVVDALVTNFHLPRSTLLLLVSAFAGRELVLKAYAHAVASGYRFYSYGDAMLIL